MSDKSNAITVVLSNDLKSEDVEPIIQAIKQIRGVLDAQPNKVDNLADFAIELRLKTRLFKRFQDILFIEKGYDQEEEK